MVGAVLFRVNSDFFIESSTIIFRLLQGFELRWKEKKEIMLTTWSKHQSSSDHTLHFISQVALVVTWIGAACDRESSQPCPKNETQNYTKNLKHSGRQFFSFDWSKICRYCNCALWSLQIENRIEYWCYICKKLNNTSRL